jgi:hypothetical protein
MHCRRFTFADIEDAIGDVMKQAMEDIRYVSVHQTDSNITRQQLHPLWEKASAIALYAMREHRAGLTPDQVREVEREQITQIYIQQIVGNCAGLAVALAMTIRTIILDTDTDPSTRAEMFARINRTGTIANEAEIRRGSLPGPVTDMIKGLAESDTFVEMTPLTEKAINQREREELVTRFFAYINTNET